MNATSVSEAGEGTTSIRQDDLDFIHDLVVDAVCELVDEPDDLRVRMRVSYGEVRITLFTPSSKDRGVLIGRDGKMINALRTLIGQIARNCGADDCSIQVVDEDPSASDS